MGTGQVNLGWICGSKVVFAPLEWHREEKPAQEEQSVWSSHQSSAESSSLLDPTLLPPLHPNPILISGHWQHKKGGHRGLGPHSRHVFAASSSLTRCYLSKDGASCRGGKERHKLVITGESLARQSRSLAGMCVKSPVSTSKQAPQGGLDPHTALPGSPKTSSEAAEQLGKPQSACWAGKNDRGKESGQGSSRDAVTRQGDGRAGNELSTQGIPRSGFREGNQRGLRDSHLWERQKGHCRGVGAFVCSATLGDSGFAPITHTIKAGHSQQLFAPCGS